MIRLVPMTPRLWGERGRRRAIKLGIDPDECIDCDACVEACPVDACFAEDQLPSEWEAYVQRNAEYFTTGAGA